MSDNPEKTIKCPECGSEYSCVDMAPHGMWEIGSFQDITFDCCHCRAVLSWVRGYLGITPEGCLTFSHSYPDSEWADKYYLGNGDNKDGAE